MKEYKLKEKERRKNRVYQVAAKTLWQKGYDKTSIRDIAKATDMTTAGLYYYFKSKEELLFQILNGHMDDMIDGIEKIPADVSEPLEVIRNYIQYQINSYCTDKHRTKLILSDDDCLTGEWYDQIKDKQRQYLGYWRKALGRYFEQEGLDQHNTAIDAHCLVGMCAWIYRWYDPKGEISPGNLADKIFETFVFGISKKGKVVSPS
ncbi:MAG: TetR/AcrR family transcriptional regulator [Desulfobacteraceae bacterium]|nr:MAG: TetR/AcrR family transcriptional regulator [Desulfobacteraceae bacterium]